jgi:NADH-quinone oxidoreductase subunit C
VSYESVPGFVSEAETHGETTVVVEPGSLVEAALHLRDELGFNFLTDIAATDYLNTPGSWGLATKPNPKQARFSVSYHLLKLASGASEAPRVRLQVWCEDGEEVPSVVSVWPTADWHEREAWDMMGIRIQGHPNLTRILMEEDWEGHPLRRDYPLGGEPVRFSSEE